MHITVLQGGIFISVVLPNYIHTLFSYVFALCLSISISPKYILLSSPVERIWHHILLFVLRWWDFNCVFTAVSSNVECQLSAVNERMKCDSGKVSHHCFCRFIVVAVVVLSMAHQASFCLLLHYCIVPIQISCIASS